jgi:glycosyltransferase involved in cell wall biosynthesis
MRAGRFPFRPGVNLAILIGWFPPAHGGAELQAEQWAIRLAPRHRVTVVTRRNVPGQSARESRDGFEVLRLPVARVPLLRTIADLAGIGRAVQSITPRPDLLLCFQTFVSGFAGVWLQDRLGIPAVVWVRGEDEIRLRARPAARWISPRVWSRARGVLLQNSEMRDALLEELAPAQRGRISDRLAVVPNGIELPAQVPFASRTERVVAVGRLIPIKGMDLVIDAAAGVPLPLTIVGDGTERRRLETRATRLGADVRFEGIVPTARMAGFYRDARCVVLASRFGEGFPNVLLEAMASGCPVVATRVTGVGGLVEDGHNGLVVPPGDARALREALTRMAREPGLAERLGSAARDTAARYAWSSVVPQLEAVLERWGRT